MTTELSLHPEQELTPEERSKVDTYKSSIDLAKSDQIISYGMASQSRLNTFADSVLNNVRSRDMGEIGSLLTNLTVDLQKFDSATKKEGRILGVFKSLKKKIAHLQAEYSKVEINISRIVHALESHVKILNKDIYIFNQQYEENWNYFRELSLYIVAGEEKIKEVNEKLLPEMKIQAETSGDDRLIHQYNDMEQQVHRFEKKIHDMKLSRMISIQLAPQIRLIQNNSITMVEKIQSTLMNTIPLWKNQMVISLGLVHAQQAVAAQKKVTNTTNELLKRNSEMLKQTTREIATESERGIIDMDTINKANEDLITAMDDLVKIQSEGRQKRIAVEVELKEAEDKLRKRLIETRNI